MLRIFFYEENGMYRVHPIPCHNAQNSVHCVGKLCSSMDIVATKESKDPLRQSFCSLVFDYNMYSLSIRRPSLATELMVTSTWLSVNEYLGKGQIL